MTYLQAASCWLWRATVSSDQDTAGVLVAIHSTVPALAVPPVPPSGLPVPLFLGCGGLAPGPACLTWPLPVSLYEDTGHWIYGPG